MALEAISGAVYYDNSRSTKQYKPDHVNVQEGPANVANINITEVTAAAGISGSNQLSKDQEKQQKDSSASEEQIKQAINRANHTMIKARTRCEFSYHEETKRVSIKVVDRDTEEIIREIPPEETLEMVEKMYELAGLLFDEKR